MSINPSFDLSVHFFAPPTVAGFVCYIVAILLATTSNPNVYWMEEVAGPVAQRFGEWASASPTFSAVTDLIAVVQGEVDRLFVLIF